VVVPHRPYPAAVDLLRLAIAVWILWTLARVARVAWRQRALAVALWRAIRPRHLAGTLGLLVVVASVAVSLVTWVPGASFGIGHLVGLTGNAIFAPLEEGLARAGPPPAGGPDWVLLVGATVFLGGLALLLPWLAFVEEEVFRAGLEDAGPLRVVIASLVFGLVHLVMLVPIGAALAIGVAGLAYAAAYRRAYRRAGALGAEEPPAVAQQVFRPTARARSAADRARWQARADLLAAGEHGPDPVDVAVRRPEVRQAAAVFSAAVWHTTFNTTLVVLVWLGLATAALAG
jgi:hypothetical protein